MSMKVKVTSLGISTKGKREMDFVYDLGGKDPYVEVEFVDEEEGFVGLYPANIESCGVKIDRTTAGSLIRVFRFLHQHQGHHQLVQYSLNGATISVGNTDNVDGYVQVVVSVEEQFVWNANMPMDSLALVGEGVEYALEQFEASLVGKDASDTANVAMRLLAEQPKPEMVHRQQAVLKKLSPDDWGTEP